MKTAVQNNHLASETFVVEIDGKIKSKYEVFFEALKAGMELKRKYPHSNIKVHDAGPRK